MLTCLWTLIVLSAGWTFYAYAGYPMALWILARVSPLPLRAGACSPPVTIIIAAFNAGKELRQKLEGSLALDYDGLVEIIVSSDGSTDDTEAIAESFADRGVVLLRSPNRAGKEAAQARAIRESTGEILVFTDVSAQLEPDALRWIVRPFADPTVGCVSSEDVVDLEGGEGAYVRYEMALRRLESRATTLIGLSGSLFAARRALCDTWPTHLASDFRTALEAAHRGLRAVSEPRARARFGTLSDPGREWGRKVRTIRRGLAVLEHHRALLSLRHGRVAFTLWGHKVARFTTPFALAVLLAASAIGAPADPMLRGLFFAQCLGYAAGTGAIFSEAAGRILVLRVLGFFLLVNAATARAWAYHVTGSRAVVWAPTER